MIITQFQSASGGGDTFMYEYDGIYSDIKKVSLISSKSSKPLSLSWNQRHHLHTYLLLYLARAFGEECKELIKKQSSNRILVDLHHRSRHIAFAIHCGKVKKGNLGN